MTNNASRSSDSQQEDLTENIYLQGESWIVPVVIIIAWLAILAYALLLIWNNALPFWGPMDEGLRKLALAAWGGALGGVLRYYREFNSRMKGKTEPKQNEHPRWFFIIVSILQPVLAAAIALAFMTILLGMTSDLGIIGIAIATGLFFDAIIRRLEGLVKRPLA